MAINATKRDTNIESMVQLLNETEAKALFGAAVASATLANPTVTWAKFTLTDDRVNGNNQRIPASEFQNIISTGVNMPIKMAVGQINPGHNDSKPLGVITALREVVTELGTKAIIALAALWDKERPADVQYIKDRFASNLPVDISWEILYEDAVFNKEQNSIDLVSTVLTAAAIVGDPAYKGRTQFLSVAAKKWSKAYVESLPKEHFLYTDSNGNNQLPLMDADGLLDRAKMQEALAALDTLNLPDELVKQKKAVIANLVEKFNAGASLKDVSAEFYLRPPESLEENKLDTLEDLKVRLSEVEAKLNEALTASSSKDALLEESKASISTLEADIAALKEELNTRTTELTGLKEFKASLDAEVERQEKLSAIRTKFSEAGVSKADDYFDSNADKLLKLDAELLDLLISESKAGQTAQTGESQASNDTTIPAIVGDGQEGSEVSVQDMAKYLRERRGTK